MGEAISQGVFPKLAKLKRSDAIYYLFFIIIECGEAFNKGTDNKIYLTFSIIGILLLIYKLVDSEYQYRELFPIMILGILGVFIFYQTSKVGGILSILALIGLKGVDIKKLLKISFFIRLTAFLILVFLSSTGMIENAMITHLRGDNAVIRYSMGFSHPNQFHLSFIILLLLWMYLSYERIGAFQLLLLGALNILVYTKSYSRTSTLIGLGAILLMLWFKSKYFPKLKNVVCMGMIPFGFLISVIPALLYDKLPYIRTIDRALQWRITFSRHYLDSYPIQLFGNNLNSDPIVLDSGYVELLINYGLIFTLLYIGAYMVIAYRYVKKRKYRELLLICCLAVYGITEAFIPNLFINLSMIFLGELIFEESSRSRGYQNES